MWFKNLMVYRASLPVSLDQLSAALGDRIFTPCGKLDLVKSGWWPPLGGVNNELTHTVDGCVMLCLRTQKKLVPADVVSAEVAARVAELGRPVFRKERRELKEDVYMTLLPRAFVQDRYTFGYFDLRAGKLIIDTASPSVAEQFVSALREALGGLKCHFVETETKPGAWLTGLGDTTEPPEDAPFIAGSNYTYQVRTGEVVRTKNVELGLGWPVTRLAVRYRDLMTFTLDSRLKFSGLTAEQAADKALEATDFDASFCIMVATVRDMLGELTAPLGGEVVPVDAH